MGVKNSICCAKDTLLYEKHHEQRLDRISSLNPQLYTPQVDQDDNVENLQRFEFSFENILKYISTTYEIVYNNQADILEKLPLLKITQEELSTIQKLQESETVYTWTKSNLDYKNKKFILKALRFNYEEAQVNQEDIKSKYPLQYFINKNIFKEMRITRNHKNINYYFSKLLGYTVDEKNCKIYFVYEHYEYSLEKFIKQRSLDFDNQIKIMKALIELIKSLHTEGIISLDISPASLRFNPKFNMKLVSLGNSFDMKSNYDIDRNSKMERGRNQISYAPEIYLKHLEKINWHSDIWSLGVVISLIFGQGGTKEAEHVSSNLFSYYKDSKVPEFFYEQVDNLFIKSMIVGILRIDPVERPNIFEIIDVYNNFIRHLKYDDMYLIPYTKEEILCKLIFNFNK
jgi:serine/threonine protein kinase